jgi:hypothetical protein
LNKIETHVGIEPSHYWLALEMRVAIVNEVFSGETLSVGCQKP